MYLPRAESKAHTVLSDSTEGGSLLTLTMDFNGFSLTFLPLTVFVFIFFWTLAEGNNNLIISQKGYALEWRMKRLQGT